jgi:AcrR family transcriptional regulator
MTITADDRDTRTRLLDAAEDCFRRYGITQTSMDDVIRTARIPRTTANRHIGTKQDLIRAVVFRELARFGERLATKLAKLKQVEEALVEGVLLSIDECHDNELIAAAMGVETIASLRANAMRHGNESFGNFMAIMEPLLQPARQSGRLRADLSNADVAEWMVRTISSFALMGDLQHRSRLRRRDYLRRMLVPALLTPS